MTKQELIEENKKLSEKIEELENDIDYWIENNDNKDNIIKELEQKVNYDNNYININDFIKRLKINNLYDEKIENFIAEYYKFYYGGQIK